MFDKTLLLQQLHEHLQDDLQLAERALQASHEAATHEQSKAENKYDTRGLEAAYLANGQQQRCLEIRQALQQLHNLQLRPVDPQGRVQLTSLVALQDAQEQYQWLWLLPMAAGTRLQQNALRVQVISPQAPLGQALLSLQEGDEVSLQREGTPRYWQVVAVC